MKEGDRWGGSRAAHLAHVAGAVLIWSTSFVATKAALVEVPPLTLGAIRFALAALLAGLVAAFIGGFGVKGVADLGRLCLGGLLGITLYFSMENVGVDLATASDAALVVASYPAIAMAVEARVRRGRLSGRRLLGVTLAIVGVNAVLGNALLARPSIGRVSSTTRAGRCSRARSWPPKRTSRRSARRSARWERNKPPSAST